MLISRLPDIVEIFFCTPDRAMDLTFQIKPIPSKFMLNLMEILIIKQAPLLLRHSVGII